MMGHRRAALLLAATGAAATLAWPHAISAHEPFCGIDAGELCTLWSARFAGGRVETKRPDRQGVVTVDLTITPDGHVSGCAISQTSGNPDLDAETCRQLQAYAHYRAALDDAGQPTVGSDTITIDWVFRAPADTPPEGDKTEQDSQPLPEGYQRV